MLKYHKYTQKPQTTNRTLMIDMTKSKKIDLIMLFLYLELLSYMLSSMPQIWLV